MTGRVTKAGAAMAKDPGPGGMRLRMAPLDIRFADAFKVRVHPDTFAKIESIAPPELRTSLLKDKDVERYRAIIAKLGLRR